MGHGTNKGVTMQCMQCNNCLVYHFDTWALIKYGITCTVINRESTYKKKEWNISIVLNTHDNYPLFEIN